MADQPQNRIALLDPKTVTGLLLKMKPQIESALPRHITPDRMARVALTALRVNPKLFSCTEESFLGSIITASQLGLEPNVLGQCYLVPYWESRKSVSICTFIPGWRGYMDLLARAGRAEAWTGGIYEGDEWDFELGDRPFLKVKPGKNHGNEKALEYTYSIGRVKDAQWPIIEAWDIDRITQHRNKNNKVGDQHYSFKNFEMYARKIPLLQVLKYLPMSVEMATASALDLAGTEGRQRLTIDGAFKASYDNEDIEMQAQIEFLIQKLAWPKDKTDKVRESYEDRPKELLSYLEKEAAPLDQNGKKENTRKKDEGKPPTESKPKDPAPDPEPKQAETAKAEEKAKDHPPQTIRQQPQRNLRF